MLAEFVPVARRIDGAIQHRLDGAVHQQVRITPDRGGKVGIGFIGKPKVAYVIGTINRLPQGSQHYRLQELRIGPVLDFGQGSCVILGAVVRRRRLSCNPNSLRKSRRATSFSGVGPS